MEKIPRRDDINGNHYHSATVHGGQRVAYEPGQMVHRIDYLTTRDNTRTVAILELHCARSSVRHTRNSEKGGAACGNRRQRELSDTGLLEEDKYLAEVNLEEMATSSGERQHYWLLAIQTARNHYTLKAQQDSQQTAQNDTTKRGAGEYCSRHFLRLEMLFESHYRFIQWKPF